MPKSLQNREQNLPHTKPALQGVTLRSLVMDSAASIFVAPRGEMLLPGRTRRGASRARQAAMYFAHVILAMSMTRAGHFFARDRTTARHACLQVEEWRESAALDRAFDRLEPAMALWLAQFSPVLLKRIRKRPLPKSYDEEGR